MKKNYSISFALLFITTLTQYANIYSKTVDIVGEQTKDKLISCYETMNNLIDAINDEKTRLNNISFMEKIKEYIAFYEAHTELTLTELLQESRNIDRALALKNLTAIYEAQKDICRLLKQQIEDKAEEKVEDAEQKLDAHNIFGNDDPRLS